jgi:hypothetical protein
MAEYSEHDIAQWILGVFAVQNKRGSELQFSCPHCDHPSFYWNTKKAVGFCHRATCRTTFTLDSMIDHIGYSPELAGYTPALDTIDAVLSKPVALPKAAKPIERLDMAVDALAYRGVTWDHIQKFRIHQDDTRLYVPMYEGGELVQYNSRRVRKENPPEDWFKAGEKPYRYASGHPITHYFLGWEECRLWGDIVLVENSFVSMWLRDIHATATFGSHLSDTHIDKLVHSRIDHITFLWDEGTEYASQKAQRKLKELGVQSKVVHITGQPDNYTKEELKELINEGK